MPAMLNTATRYDDAGAEPAPTFATGAKIELAQRLRTQLEQRYFGSTTDDAPQTRYRGPPAKQD